MNSFDTYLLRRIYKKIAKLGDKLAEADAQIDWTTLRPIINDLYLNDTEKGGRPNVDEVVMVKLLVLQQWLELSDEGLERQANDRISFQRFLGYPDPVPYSTTIWLFRERLAETGKDMEVWDELKRQLDAKGMGEGREVAQDASMITADPGPSSKPRGEEAVTRRSRDGTWAKRLRESFFGFKLHVKTDLGFGLVRAVAVTSASVHDSRVDLSEPGEVVYRDKGYFGVESRGFDATMRRGVRGHPLGDADRSRNRRIGLKRMPVERTFAVIKRALHAGHMLVTSVVRVRVKMVFSCFCFNLLQLGTVGCVL